IREIESASNSAQRRSFRDETLPHRGAYRDHRPFRSVLLTSFRGYPAIRAQPLSLVQPSPLALGASVSYCSPHALPFGSPAASLSTERPVALRLPTSRRGCPSRGVAPRSTAHATLINGGRQRICQGVVGNLSTGGLQPLCVGCLEMGFRETHLPVSHVLETSMQPFVSLCVRGGAMEIKR